MKHAKRSKTNWLLAAGLGAVTLAATLWGNRRGSYDLNGRVVLITGGSRGLGLVLARQAVAEGARVAICARDEAELARARQDLLMAGAAEADVLTLSRDITSEAEVRSMVAEVETRLGPVDVLINNAGIITAGPLDNMDLRDFEDSMAVHFWAPLHAMQAVLPSMRQRGAGRIVNISSLGGKVALPHMAPYSASKFALVGLSEGFRAELRQHGVSVTTVCPGLLRTGSAGHALVKGQHRKEFAWFSIADSLPGFTLSAEQAARQIWNACRRGDGEVILSLPAKFLAAFHGLLPGTTTDILSWMNRALPATGESAAANVRRTGFESESKLTRSPLTALNRKAAAKNRVRPFLSPVGAAARKPAPTLLRRTVPVPACGEKHHPTLRGGLLACNAPNPASGNSGAIPTARTEARYRVRGTSLMREFCCCTALPSTG